MRLTLDEFLTYLKPGTVLDITNVFDHIVKTTVLSIKQDLYHKNCILVNCTEGKNLIIDYNNHLYDYKVRINVTKAYFYVRKIKINKLIIYSHNWRS